MAIGALRRRGGLRSDVAMAILFAVCFAAGIVLLRKAKRTEQTFDPEQLLFGNILLVGADDLWIVLGIAAVTLGFVVFAWTRIAYATFDEELARLSGIEVGWLESALLALLAAVVVAAIRLAGVVLVSAFLVIPAAAGRLIGRSLTGVVRLGDARWACSACSSGSSSPIGSSGRRARPSCCSWRPSSRSRPAGDASAPDAAAAEAVAPVTAHQLLRSLRALCCARVNGAAHVGVTQVCVLAADELREAA